MKKHVHRFSEFGLVESVSGLKDLDPHEVAFFVMVEDELDSAHDSERDAWLRVYDLADTVYSQEASDIAMELCGNNEERYIEEYENAINNLAEYGDLIEVISMTPYQFERRDKIQHGQDMFGV